LNQEDTFKEMLAMLEEKLSILPDKSEETADNTLRALWQTAAGNRVSPIIATNLELPALSPSQICDLKNLISDRISGMPLAHITERQNFMGIDYILNKGHYIPRKETELLAKTAIDTISSDFANNPEIIVLDLCTGIGTVALAIAYYSKNAKVFGSDIFLPAIEAANINTKHFSLEKRAMFFHANMYEPFETLSLKQKTNVIVSAPPYISSEKVKNMNPEIANYEPKEAFDAGPTGLSIFSSLISVSPEYLSSDGYLIFECGLGQGEFLANRIEADGRYGPVTKVKDALGNVRVLKARKAE